MKIFTALAISILETDVGDSAAREGEGERERERKREGCSLNLFPISRISLGS